MAKKLTGSNGVFWANAVVHPTRVGDLCFLKHDKFIGRSLTQYGEWAQLEIDRLLQFIKPGDFVLDVGANIGFHTLSFARHVGSAGRVWAFEPDPVNGILLRLNILNSGMEGAIVPFDVAASDALGICRFRSYPISMPENFGHTAIDEVEGDYPRVAVALDALKIDRAPALIKIDIEGHELQALEGMREMIEKHHPVLSIEADSSSDADAIAAMVCDLGYDAYDFITDAYNRENFAGREEDIWKGHGRCSNLLCVMPRTHQVPSDLPLRQAAGAGNGGLTRMGRSVGAVYAAQVDAPVTGGTSMGAAGGDMQKLRSDVRVFVSGFLRSTYGKLDPDHYGELVNHALDYLAAGSADVESKALGKLVVAGVDAFSQSIVRTKDAEQRIKIQAQKASGDLSELNAKLTQLESELDKARHDGEVAGKAMLDLRQKSVDQAARLTGAQAQLDASGQAVTQLNATLARQSSLGRAELKQARDELARVQAQSDEARTSLEADFGRRLEEQAERFEQQQALLAGELEERNRRLAAEADEAVNAQAEARERLARMEREKVEAEGKLAQALAVNEDARERLARIDREKCDAESKLTEALAVNKDAQARLAVQSQEIRRLRATK
ncbi:FkbM family methyltransferase [Novosphingobium lentum]|uniref:FkbM family methyltransferase n=1 Tax=Novosphingobium lentum TaxID=145287 RepID=UPI0008376241|nr:FkbM family methyltransferase [Novosphingobium lentum]